MVENLATFAAFASAVAAIASAIAAWRSHSTSQEVARRHLYVDTRDILLKVQHRMERATRGFGQVTATMKATGALTGNTGSSRFKMALNDWVEREKTLNEYIEIADGDEFKNLDGLSSQQLAYRLTTLRQIDRYFDEIDNTLEKQKEEARRAHDEKQREELYRRSPPNLSQ